MKKYLVKLCYLGYADIEVEAESMEEAYEKAEQESEGGLPTQGDVLDSLARWRVADTVEHLRVQLCLDEEKRQKDKIHTPSTEKFDEHGLPEMVEVKQSPQEGTDQLHCHRRDNR